MAALSRTAAMPDILRALQSRNYRLYFCGQLVSLAGTWMQQVAMSWLAYRLTGSAFVLGLIALGSQLPILIFAPLGGLWSDRYDRRKVLLWTQTLSLLQAVLLTVLTWNNLITPSLLVALALFLGCINAADVPARQAFSVQLVDNRDDLPNAIALNSFIMNAARFVGPGLAGFIVTIAGETVCFLLNALSYLAVLLALAAIRSAPRRDGENLPALQALREGFSYAFAQPAIRTALLLVACISFFVAPYTVLMPLFAKEIFNGDARTFGLLLSSAGIGALGASVNLARRSSIDGLDRFIAKTAIGAGLAILLFTATKQIWLAYPALMVLGFCLISTIAGNNTMVQTRVDNHFRGRVMSIFSMSFLGIAPLGSFLVGSVAHLIGVRPTLAACGLLTVTVGLIYRRSLARGL